MSNPPDIRVYRGLGDVEETEPHGSNDRPVEVCNRSAVGLTRRVKNMFCRPRSKGHRGSPDRQDLLRNREGSDEDEEKSTKLEMEEIMLV